MAKVTPAQIEYTPTGKATQTIKFNAVMAEAHQASAKVTKFPVQTGFMISNNVIRQNRVITITGMMSNVLKGEMTSPGALGGEAIHQAGQHRYGSDNVSATYSALESLVNSGTPCKVLTNLGIYNPVVWTKLSTKQAPGMVDSMLFTITGEEIMVSDTVNGTAPKILSFSAVTGAAKDNRIIMLEDIGIEVCDCNVMTEAYMVTGQDFIIEGLNSAGLATSTTYLATGLDPFTGQYTYEQHTSDIQVYGYNNSSASESSEAALLANDDRLRGGFSQVGDCVEAAAVDVATEFVEDTIETAMGELTKSLYGAFYDTVNLTDNEYGQSLISSSVGCFVRGVTGVVSEFPYQPGEALPRTDQILDGAKKWGAALYDKTQNSNNALGINGNQTVVTRIECCE